MNWDKLLQYQKVGIITHMQPDADALGSCFALQIVLGVERATVLLEKRVSDFLFLEFGEVSVSTEDKDFDALVVVDAHQLGRLGAFQEFVANFKKDIFVVDHHQIGEGKLQSKAEIIDPTAVSTGILLFKMFCSSIGSRDIAEKAKFARAVYYTILGDTDGFQNRNLNAECFSVCATLVDWGLDPAKAYESFFCKMNVLDFAYLSEVYRSVREYEQGKIVFAFGNLELQKRLGYTYEDLPSVMGRLKQLQDYQIIVFFKEQEEGCYKLSFRSKSVDVRSICSHYGGGGHLLAAGCRIEGDIKGIEKEVLAQCKKML